MTAAADDAGLPAEATGLPAEATGSAPGRDRLAGRKILVVGAGTRPSPEPDPPIGNGRAIAVLAAREGASVACADRDRAAAGETAGLVRAEGSEAVVVVADVADRAPAPPWSKSPPGLSAVWTDLSSTS